MVILQPQSVELAVKARIGGEFPRSSMARTMLMVVFTMKDLLFILATATFFTGCWLYARSFDSL